MEFDVVVIGGGPSGMAAALESAKTGAKTLLLERESKLGGILNQCIHNGFGLHYFKQELTGPEYALRFADMISSSDVTVWLDTFVTSVDEKALAITVINPSGEQTIQAKAIVMAMGCRERVPAGIGLKGTRPVGVYTAGQVQQIINIKGKLPCKKAVILGSGDIGLIMARRLTLQGAKVECVLEIMEKSSGLQRNISQCLNDFNIPLKYRHTVSRVVGDTRVTGVYVAEANADFSIKPETEKLVECDALILSVGLIPEVELIKGLTLHPKTGGADVDEFRQTNLPGIFSCGNVLHVNDLVDNVTEESCLAGRCAGLYALNKLQKSQGFKIIAGDGVSYCSPSVGYKNGDKLIVYFRLIKSVKKSYLIATCNGQEAYKKLVLGAHGGEMQKIEIEKSKIDGDITVLVKEQ